MLRERKEKNWHFDKRTFWQTDILTNGNTISNFKKNLASKNWLFYLESFKLFELSNWGPATPFLLPPKKWNIFLNLLKAILKIAFTCFHPHRQQHKRYILCFLTCSIARLIFFSLISLFKSFWFYSFGYHFRNFFMLDHFSKVVSFMYSNSITIMTKLQTVITQLEYTFYGLWGLHSSFSHSFTF